MRWLTLIAVAHLIAFLSSAEITCPRIPEKCDCKISKSMIILSCNGEDVKTIAQTVGTSQIDELHILNGTDVKIESLPFNGLRTIAILNSTLQSFSPTAWRHVEATIEHITINGNELKTVPVFGNLSTLMSMNLNSNQISSIPDKAFNGLSALTQLRLENNAICDFPPKSLDAVKASLVLLDVSGNCLDAIPAQILRNAANLMYLDLGSNNISEINNFELMNLPFLRELRVQNNTLRRIHPMAFMNVPQLQYLYLQDNIISTLDGNRLQGFKNLEVLDVSNNALYALPSLKDLPNLKQVRVDGNLITKIETLAFSNNPNLQLISVQNNNIVQISRNSFESLDKLVVLLVGNNSLAKIERGMFDGMKNLQQLSIRNNTLTALDASSFAQLAHLTTLDLGHNKIHDIEEGTFDKLSKLFWLDLSNNKISGFKTSVFKKKISNILLDGNQLICDESFNEFLTYLIANKVRTFLPFQQEIMCHGPEKYAGVRLKDLMMKKANETLSEGSRLLGVPQGSNQHSLLSSFLPSLGPLGTLNGAGGAAIPLVNTLTNTIPALRSIPGFGGNIPVGTGASSVPNKNLNDAIEGFTGPLVRFATGGQPVASDIEQLIRSIPNMVVNVPGFGDIDLSKMDPTMIQYVLNGGQIPGIDKATLDKIVKQTMNKMHTAAAANLAGNPVEGQEKVLPPLDKLPSGLVTQVMSGEPLPGLNENQTKIIMEYYTHQMPGMDGIPARPVESQGNTTANNMFNPAMFDLLKMLPPGYNLSKIPMEVIAAVTRGEVPDMRLLPEDLLEHFKQHTTSLTSMFAGATAKNISIEEILEKLPVFVRPELSTFVPYDINELTSEMVLEQEQNERHRNIRIITAIALAFVGAVTVVVIIFFVNYTKKQRRLRKSLVYRSSPSSSGSSGQNAANESGRSSAAPSPIRPPLMNIPKTPNNRTMESTFGQPQLCSTLLENPQAVSHRSRH
ncbi:Leucine-rich repeat-containing protein egg-6 [Caenorhabditis elegans]|uniref:Leucine-rich repeat-containing protein egg-6 n=1 Tax=Caenorhabditis elegans TaxID=6239 RepID=EGG6_CAEEL|nr:Leucine-rich repeat-containing protein egg-6 [Caenorhabditis elegans]P90920.2 RecName: Full=Leucine-rich repeat-containing protein egg-6; Flags: Precursor [Caenorhabditis elegans]AEZ55700.1 EGG-6 [Caenorhabditis elegans]CAB03182.1 Leucine-rich repeat-containing protein egg-6 [Caenorhabditis elegans]|eukprot:NP_492348.1 Leucine-rich repeat-containing protein egg-6 [Caenorhabditis elegans]